MGPSFPLAPYLLSAAVCTAMAALLVRWKDLLGILDVPNHRSSHDRPMPRTGGIAVFCGVVAGAFFLGGLNPSPTVLAGLCFFLLGLADDFWRLSEKVRLSVQLAAALALAAAGVRLEALAIPGLGFHILPLGLSYAITAFWLCGFVNVFNFMDGIDGLAASEAVLAGLLIHLMTGDAWPLLASAAGLGFFALNRQPARIFLGDSGSYLLGYLLAVSCLGPAHAAPEARPPFLAFVLVLGAFIADAGATLVRRIVHGENWLSAHRSHYYQKLTSLGWSHARTASVYGLTTAALGLSALSYVRVGDFLRAGLLLLWAGVFSASIYWVHRCERAKA